MTEPNNQLLSNFVDFLQTMNQNNQQERAYIGIRPNKSNS